MISSLSQQLSTGLKRIKPIVNCNEADYLFEELNDLVNSDFKPWYCKQFYRLGRKKVEILASQARADGFNKAKLFSKLLKQS